MGFADRDGTIWLDGEMVPWREAKVHVLTHTLHYGLGVFEGVRAYATPDRGTCIFRLNEHTDRLFNSAKILGMRMPYDRDTLLEAQRAVVRENGLGEAYLRPMCFYGSEGMGLRAENLKTHVMVAAWEWPSYMDPEAHERGIKARTSSYTRHHVNITMCKAKANGNYINSMLALREAVDSGAEEALMLDNEGYVAEGSGENVLWCAKGIFSRRTLPPVWTVSPAARCSRLPPSSATPSRNAASPATSCISPTRPSLPAPRPKWSPFANWIAA